MAEREQMSLRELSVLQIPGIGPDRAARLERLGIHTVHELLFHFPFRHDSRYNAEELATRAGGVVTVLAVVQGPVSVRFRGKRSTLSVSLLALGDKPEPVTAVFFNQPYLRHQLEPGKRLQITGKYEAGRKIVSVSSYTFHLSQEAAFQPVYHSCQGVSVNTLRKYIECALESYGDQLVDEFPHALRSRFKLLGLLEAVCNMHFPTDQESLRQARRRLIFEEFLHFQLRIQGFRHARETLLRKPLEKVTLQAHAADYVQSIPFALTASQERAIAEVLEDICSVRPMHRLLQGDVGAGKTAVAFAACVALGRLGYQTAMMAPTSILAQQHARDALQWLPQLGITVVDLTGVMDARKTREHLRQIESGEATVIIGTHALVSERVTFSNLRLVITDEQHRFGVAIRKLLREKGESVDVLQLSATPIPRTLALTLYGDLEVSTMTELPPGRQPVKTVRIRRKDRDRVFRLIRTELAKGHQAYLVAPRIDSDEETDGVSATELWQLCEDELGAWQVGLLHGQMVEHDRVQMMTAFVRGDVQVLVATTIIEVGVSVANATVMVVFEAERFGLATLHQLRGRVGRSSLPSTCVLISDANTVQAKARLQALVHSHNGFELAEQDLLLRGPGEVFGERQSGLPIFAVGDVIADRRIMEVARDVARSLLTSEAFWLQPSYLALRIVAQGGDTLADS